MSATVSGDGVKTGEGATDGTVSESVSSSSRPPGTFSSGVARGTASSMEGSTKGAASLEVVEFISDEELVASPDGFKTSS